MAEFVYSQTFSVLYRFRGGNDGANPAADLTIDAAGNIYGATRFGGVGGHGVIFEINSKGEETVLHAFGPVPDGSDPGSVIRDKAGNLYGTTGDGGQHVCNGGGCGVVFRLDPANQETILYDFTGHFDGQAPNPGLVLDSAGNLYGTTSTYNQGQGGGVVFKITPQGAESVLHHFTGPPDGDGPAVGLITDQAGNLYGTTQYGGDLGCEYGCGIVFRIDATGRESVLYSFTDRPDGSLPFARLIHGAQGSLIGSTFTGGQFGYGTIFALDSQGSETILHSFGSTRTEGKYPLGKLVRDNDGNLYGVTYNGGHATSGNPQCFLSFEGCGTVFKLDKTGKQTVLHTFIGLSDGMWPEGGLVRDTAGNLYGTAVLGGDLNCEAPDGCGVVFKITP